MKSIIFIILAIILLQKPIVVISCEQSNAESSCKISQCEDKYSFIQNKINNSFTLKQFAKKISEIDPKVILVGETHDFHYEKTLKKFIEEYNTESNQKIDCAFIEIPEGKLPGPEGYYEYKKGNIPKPIRFKGYVDGVEKVFAIDDRFTNERDNDMAEKIELIFKSGLCTRAVSINGYMHLQSMKKELAKRSLSSFSLRWNSTMDYLGDYSIFPSNFYAGQLSINNSLKEFWDNCEPIRIANQTAFFTSNKDTNFYNQFLSVDVPWNWADAHIFTDPEVLVMRYFVDACKADITNKNELLSEEMESCLKTDITKDRCEKKLKTQIGLDEINNASIQCNKFEEFVDGFK
ncbi:MAG: hypothetical protein A2381_00770 [Bdellovibrionales bacterium RIFOXYB1_FULL_37_110]|nr:MAG: hypothetical protein A2417_01625 [Bdellovibrionales bacterium RIFOXYC1_FULL_37_79]OFZ58752.1 MAG: hypothetical protein A2381_00770 [Bdellovibrionales bacterium RIFOXYB1_FULL_37_110]OFZ64751.1 MAG: hypothetical protein A2577_06770 [Bdellovibrionales bacterium RIFOXYD1_FULL_36_51]